MSHQEVVKLIKCKFLETRFALVLLDFQPAFHLFSLHTVAGQFVALTLQGPPPSTAALPLEPLPSDPTPNQRQYLSGEAPPSPPPPVLSGLYSAPSQRITGPKPLQVTGALSRINPSNVLHLCNIEMCI